jgi:hypothetical protein
MTNIIPRVNKSIVILMKLILQAMLQLMSTKRIPYILLMLFFCFAGEAFIFASDKKWPFEKIQQLNAEKNKVEADIRLSEDALERCDFTVRNKALLDMAKYKGNQAMIEWAGKELQKAQEDRAKDFKKVEEMKSYLKVLEDNIKNLKANPATAEANYEQFRLEHKSAEWLAEKDAAILERLSKNNPYYDGMYKSLKTNAPPPLQEKTFKELQTGDIILLNAAGEGKNLINEADKFLSGTDSSSASHALIFLKEVNGKKLFLDNQPNLSVTSNKTLAGPRIISEEQYWEIYGQREGKVARLAEPLTPQQAKDMYEAASELAKEQLKEKPFMDLGFFSFGSNYGTAGTNMVCSESSRWVLIQSGVPIKETTDFLKKNVLSINFSPADFVKSTNFIIRPLSNSTKSVPLKDN